MQPDEFTPDKYYVITKRKVFVFIVILVGMTTALIAETLFMVFLYIVKTLS